MCKLHYEMLCERAAELDSSDLMKLLQFEHAEMYGKPKERVEVSGEGGGPIEIAVHWVKKDET